MSDEKLRELERAFQGSGSEEAELAWLRERARAGEKLNWESYSRLHELDMEAAAGYLRSRVETGDLSRERLELACFLGHLSEFPRRSQPPPFSELARIAAGASLDLDRALWTGVLQLAKSAWSQREVSGTEVYRSGHSPIPTLTALERHVAARGSGDPEELASLFTQLGHARGHSKAALALRAARALQWETGPEAVPGAAYEHLRRRDQRATQGLLESAVLRAALDPEPWPAKEGGGTP